MASHSAGHFISRLARQVPERLVARVLTRSPLTRAVAPCFAQSHRDFARKNPLASPTVVRLRSARSPTYIGFMQAKPRRARPDAYARSLPNLALHAGAHCRSRSRDVPDDELLRRLDELVSHSRRVEADLVAHIGEVDDAGSTRVKPRRRCSSTVPRRCTSRRPRPTSASGSPAPRARTRAARHASRRPTAPHRDASARTGADPENRDALLARATPVRSARSWRSSPSSRPGRTSRPACASCPQRATRCSQPSRTRRLPAGPSPGLPA